VRPLLKWAGGKRQLLPALEQYYPLKFERYLEPFVGSGAVFFHLASAGMLEGRPVILSDINTDLIGCYRAVRDETESVIASLQTLEREHRRRGDACYYDVRDERFNPLRATRMNDANPAAAASAYPPELAAMLIFLNRTGFNGLFRLNKSGEFNVPAGRYRDPRICDPDHIRTVAAVLRRRGVAIEYRGFEEALGKAGKGDFVYCDPPYAPISRDVELCELHRGRLCLARSAASAAGCRPRLQPRRARGDVELERAGDRNGLSDTRRRSESRSLCIAFRRGGQSTRAGSSRGPVDELIITNVPAALGFGTGRGMMKASGLRAQATGLVKA
jgi:DNA adenine methylase Dam